ncbi:hypothetical protein D770_16690 [Flammeovirgaceae bacterium 311]|nr:hypothetical protein D770_16690 [Flammeovirgaceae bacterium 311]
MSFFKNNGLPHTFKKGFLIKAALLLWCLMLPFLAFSQFITKGDAVKVSDRCFKVTEDEHGRYGAVWWDRKVDLRKPLELDFVIFLGSRDADGADGIAFVLHNDTRGYDAKGTPGGGLGFAYHPTYSTDATSVDVIKPSVSIEFDTFKNTDLENEIEEDHTTIVYDGDLSRVVTPAISINPDQANVEDNQCHDYKIKWNPSTQELQLYFDGKLRISHKDDIINKLFDGNPLVYYGFTGSTGGQKNEQTVCIYSADSKPVAQNDSAETEPIKPVSISALENDSHTTGDPISLTAIVEQPKNGMVHIAGDQLIYTPGYGFVGTDYFTYEVCETGSDKCYTKCTTAVVKVEVVCRTFPQAPIAQDVSRCGPGIITLMAQGAEVTDSYRWYVSATATTPIAGETGNLFTTPNLSATTTFYVSSYNGSCESRRTPVQAVIQEIPYVYAGENTRVYEGEQVQLAGVGEGFCSWFPIDGLDDPHSLNPIAQPEKTITYTLTVTDVNGCSSAAEITITVVKGIFVPNAFSPNDDGLNDVWEIFKISRYPQCRVAVYSRWGDLVFHSDGYKTPWDGTYKGKKLPLGSYAYIIHLGEGEKPVTGSVSVMY